MRKEDDPDFQCILTEYLQQLEYDTLISTNNRILWIHAICEDSSLLILRYLGFLPPWRARRQMLQWTSHILRSMSNDITASSFIQADGYPFFPHCRPTPQVNHVRYKHLGSAGLSTCTMSSIGPVYRSPGRSASYAILVIAAMSSFVNFTAAAAAFSSRYYDETESIW